MDYTPMDRAAAWGVAAAAAARAAGREVYEQRKRIGLDTEKARLVDEEPDMKKRRKVEMRSVLVRDLPRHLDEEGARNALKTLFTGFNQAIKADPCRLEEKGSQRRRVPPPPVAACVGALPQSSWQNNRQHSTLTSGQAAVRREGSIRGQKELFQMLPHAVSSIRVATDRSGGSTYALVDFSDELLANLAIQLLGHSAYLPGTKSWAFGSPFTRTGKRSFAFANITTIL